MLQSAQFYRATTGLERQFRHPASLGVDSQLLTTFRRREFGNDFVQAAPTCGMTVPEWCTVGDPHDYCRGESHSRAKPLDGAGRRWTPAWLACHKSDGNGGAGRGRTEAPRFRNQQVDGSSPFAGSRIPKQIAALAVAQRGRATVDTQVDTLAVASRLPCRPRRKCGECCYWRKFEMVRSKQTCPQPCCASAGSSPATCGRTHYALGQIWS